MVWRSPSDRFEGRVSRREASFSPPRPNCVSKRKKTNLTGWLSIPEADNYIPDRRFPSTGLAFLLASLNSVDAAENFHFQIAVNKELVFNHFYICYYPVIVNEKTRPKKFITKGDPIFKFGTWEEYVLSCFAVEFDLETNPLRQDINRQVMNKDIQKNSTLQPKEIRGNWPKVSWQQKYDQKQRVRFGWIRWKQDQTIVLDFFEKA